ncbi:MAG: alpha/beta hydrolase [Thermoprotei archaeon]
MNYDNAEIELSGLMLDYRIEGVGQPPLVLLHGFRAHSGTWRKNVPVFAKQRMVIAPSLPLYEESPHQLARIYKKILEEFFVRIAVTSFVLIGNSLGGLVSMLYASENPNQVCAVVLEDSAGYESEVLENFSKKGIPTLIVWGEKDTLIPLTSAYIFKEKMPQSELVVIRGAGHVPHWEIPESFNKKIISFLKEKGC